MAVARQLGRAGGAAGVKVRCDVGGRKAPLAHQPVGRLVGAQGMEVQHAFRQGAGHRQRLPVRGDQQEGSQFRQQRLQLQGLGAHAGIIVVAMRDQRPRTAGAQQRQQLVVAEQRVQRLHDAGGLAAPQREVVGQPAGQHHCHHVLEAQAQLTQQVRGLVHAVEQGAVGPAGHRAPDLAGMQEGQRRAVRVRLHAVANEIVGAGPRHGLRQRPLLQAMDVRFRTDGGGGNNGHGRQYQSERQTGRIVGTMPLFLAPRVSPMSLQHAVLARYLGTLHFEVGRTVHLMQLAWVAFCCGEPVLQASF